MFDGLQSAVSDLASLSDAELVAAAGGWARAENAACAHKLAVAAEMGAAVNVSQGMALHQTTCSAAG